VNLAAIPSPTTASWHLGPITIRAYALCIIAGIVAACVVTEVRMRRRGAAPWAVLDIAVWAVLFGIVGARIYHVLSSPAAYFGPDGNPLQALMIWKGGLGIWGGIAGGAFGAWLACRQLGMPLTFVADALAPGLPLAQAIGRLGNWFNNELYGGRTDLPWGLEIHKIDPETGKAYGQLPGLYHPTFLYELLWNLGVALLVWRLDRRYKFGKGRAFALYVMAYTAGRTWIEAMRTDEAVHVLGARLNVWTSIVVFLGALVYFLRKHGPREYLLADGDRFRVVTEEEFAAHRAGAAAGGADASADVDAAEPSAEKPEAAGQESEPAEHEPAGQESEPAEHEPAGQEPQSAVEARARDER
jgi:prolipoprotein diacylglyceryl transferase